MNPIYKDASRAIPERVADLLGRMSLEEKFAQMHAFWLILSEDGKHRPREDSFAGGSDADTLQTMLSFGLGQITRPLGTHCVDALPGVRAFNRLQKFLCEETRLGIPAMSHEECLLGLMARGGTLFPSPLAFGATWNPDLVREVGRVIGKEARSIGCHQGLAPVLDVSRDVRWGRTEETFGEDPYAVGVMATRYVEGLQGPKRDLLATLKHYVGHSFSEGARNHAPVHLGWRELNDIFMLPFEMAVKSANAGSVMPAYHDIDNEPCHASHHLLTEVLRDQWGFDGLVVADYIGISLLYQHHGVAVDAAEAAAQSFNAGLDIELPGDDCAKHLSEAMARGLLSIEKVDEIVARILTEKFRLGLFEKPYADENAIALQTPEALAVAREAARQSIVLLENRGILPLTTNGSGKIAVIGPTADDPLALLGGYSFPVHLILSDMAEAASQVVTPLQGLQQCLGKDRVQYAKGCHILEYRSPGAPAFPGDVSHTATVEGKSLLSQDTSLIPEAVACASSADVAVVCVGDLAGLFQTGTVGEGSDTDSLSLPGIQQQLLQAIVDTGKPVIVVLTGGRPYNLGGLEDKVAALLWCFTSGQEGGHALAELLSGQIEPCGHLPISFPRNVGAVPYFYNHKLKSAGTPIALHFGSRYPFGYGLSYTHFVYEDLQIEEANVPSAGGEIRLSCLVRNSGSRNGVAVPQLYVRDVQASLVRPVRELKAFGRIALAAGQAARVHFSVPVDMLNFTDYSGKRVVEPGQFLLQIGSSSSDIALEARINVCGEVRALQKDWRMFSDCRFDLLPD